MRKFLGKKQSKIIVLFFNQKFILTLFYDKARLKAHRVKQAEAKIKQKSISLLASARLGVLSKKECEFTFFYKK